MYDLWFIFQGFWNCLNMKQLPVFQHAFDSFPLTVPSREEIILTSQMQKSIILVSNIRVFLDLLLQF